MAEAGDTGGEEAPAAILVEGLSKRYRPAEVESGSAAGRAQPAPAAPGAEDDLGDDDDDDLDDYGATDESDRPLATRVCALEDVSFHVGSGEAVGVVGPAAAGKTTLLKILAQVAPPTEGRITIHGRVAALLGSAERLLVQDLDVARNVRLLATLLGCPADVAGRRLPEIRRFAELTGTGRTPLRRLPREARRRLACATALHLDADILLVDDVFGRDDLEFRERCVRRIGDENARGVTVLFASNRLDTVGELCQTVVWLENGVPRAVGPAGELVERYRGELGEAKRARLDAQAAEPANGVAIIAAAMQAGRIELLLAVPTGSTELLLGLSVGEASAAAEQLLTADRPGTYRARARVGPPASSDPGGEVRATVRAHVEGEDGAVSAAGVPGLRLSEADAALVSWELDYVGGWTFPRRESG